MADQQELPFGAAEGSYQERRALLACVVRKARKNIYLARLLERLFEATAGGKAGIVSRSYQEWADDPWGLCCSRATAERTIVQARSAGLILVDVRVAADGTQCRNGYSIDWDGVRRYLQLPQQTPHRPPYHSEVVPPRCEDGPPQPEVGPPLSEPVPPQPEVGTEYGDCPRASTSAVLACEDIAERNVTSVSFVENVRTLEGEKKDVSTQAIRHLARTIATKLGPSSDLGLGQPLSARQITDLLKVSWLALSQYGEPWLHKAVGATLAKKRHDIGYLKGILANTSGDRERFFKTWDAMDKEPPWTPP